MMEATTADFSREPHWPYPPRRWWLKRLALGSVLLVVALGCLRAWWGWEARRRLERTVAEMAARGGPVSLAELSDPPVPDGHNAAAYLRRAADAIVPGADSPSSSSLEYNASPPYPPAWHTLSDNSVKMNGAAYVLAREARAHGQADWGVQYTTPSFQVRLSHLNATRHLANIVSDAALREHVHGNDAAALEAVRDVLHQGRAVAAQPTVISYLVGLGVESVAMYKLQTIAAGVRIAPGQDVPSPTAGRNDVPADLLPATRPSSVPRPATRGQVEAVVAELLDDRAWGRALPQVLAGEQVMQLDTGLWLAGASRLLRPMVVLDAVRVVQTERPHADAAREPTWPRAAAVLKRGGRLDPPPPKHYLFGQGPEIAPGQNRPPVNYSRLLSDGDLPVNGWRMIMQDMRARQQRRATAVSLAAQLYRDDHGGAWPASLQDLVPKYLPTVPADPFDPNGGPLRYLLARGALPGGGDRPVVYSVGENGRDDTPDAKALPPEPHFGWDRWRDNCLDLAMWTPPAAPRAPATAPASAPATAPSSP